MGPLKWASVGVVLVGVILERYSDGIEKARRKVEAQKLKEKSG